MGLRLGSEHDPVMQDKQSQFQAIAHAGLIENLAQRVLDSLFGAAQVRCDLAILKTMRDERNNSHFKLRETLAKAKSDRALLGLNRLAAHETQNPPAAGQVANTSDNSRLVGRALHNSVHVCRKLGQNHTARLFEQQDSRVLPSSSLLDLSKSSQKCR